MGSKQVIDGPYRVRPIRPYQCKKLAQLFSAALEHDFDYYSELYRAQTRKQNTAPKLALSSLRSDRLLLGVWHHDGLVGYLIGATRPSSRGGDIFWLYVAPSHRKKGVGAKLLVESLTWFANKGLKNVELATYDQADFYKKYNFQVERLAKGFIGGQDVYIMKRSLL